MRKINPDTINQLRMFIVNANHLVSDLQSKVDLAKFIIAESEKPNGNWFPAFPTSRPANFDTVLEHLTIINYIQSTDHMKAIKAANPAHPRKFK